MRIEAESIQFLYVLLTNDGSPVVDWDKVGTTLDLKKGAVTKRWSRLKQVMEKGDTPGGSAYQFLWLCAKHSSREGTIDWHKIAAKCNITHGAASKRYSRLQRAFNKGVDPPGLAPPTGEGKTTMASIARKSGPKQTQPVEDLDKTSLTTNKRKHAPAKKNVVKPEPSDKDDGEAPVPPKRVKKAAARSKANTKAKMEKTLTTEATTWVKSVESEEPQAFWDTQEHLPEKEDDKYVAKNTRILGWLEKSAQ